MTQDVAAIGIKVDTDGVQRGIKSLEQLVGVGPKVEQSMDRVNAGARKAGRGLKEIDGQTVSRELGGVATAASKVSAALSMLAAGGAVLALGGLTAAASGAVAELYRASAELERLKIGLDFATTTTSAVELQYLRNITKELGLEFTATAQAYKSFLIASKGTAIEGAQARAVFESLTKASAVFGMSSEQSAGAFLAAQQMISKGKVQAEELVGQWAERIPGAVNIAARAMGVTTAELYKMMEAGNLMAVDFLPKFAKELEASLGGAAEKAANRLDAATNRYFNAVERLKQSAGDSGVSSAWARELTAMSRDIDAVTDAIGNATEKGAGAFSSLAQGAAVAAGRAGFATLNLAANTVNGTINLLTGDLLQLRTDLAVLPAIFRSNAEGAAALHAETARASAELKAAEANLADLEARGAKSGSNLMLREAYNHAQRLVNKLREAKAAQDALTGTSSVSEALRNAEAGNSRGSRANYYKELEASQQKLLTISARENGITKQFTDDLSTYAQALKTGAMSAGEYTAAVTKLNAEREKALQKRAGNGGGSKGTKDAERLDAAMSRSVVSQIQSSLQDLTSSYSVAESIMEARRSAGLLSEQDYYTAKRSFIELNKQAQLSALAEENAALAKQQLKGAEAVARDQKIAENKAKLAQLSLEASGKLEVLDIQQAASARQHEASLLAAKQAADEYIDSIQRASTIAVMGVGRGDRWSQDESGRLGVSNRFADQRRELANQRALAEMQAGGALNADTAKLYDEKLAIITSAEQRALAVYQDGIAQRLAAEGNWANGAARAYENYADNAANVAAQTADLFTKAFQGMEDALVSFITTGKLDFNSLANSIVADITRIIVKQQLSNALGLAGGAGSGGGLMSLIGAGIGLFGGTSAVASTASALPGDALDNFIKLKGLSSGGYTGHGGKYEPKGVVHGGEFVINAASTKKLGLAYLNGLNGYANGGYVGSAMPAAANPQQGGGQAQPQVLHVTVQMPAQGATRETALQFGRTAGRQMQVALRRND